MGSFVRPFLLEEKTLNVTPPQFGPDPIDTPGPRFSAHRKRGALWWTQESRGHIKIQRIGDIRCVVNNKHRNKQG